MKILTAIRGKLTDGETSMNRQLNYYSRRKQGFDCWLKCLEGWKNFHRYTIEDNNAARRLAEEAISICPDNPEGYALLSLIYAWDIRLGNTKSPGETFKKAMEFAQKALALDDSFTLAHVALCSHYLYIREYDKAIAEAARAVALDPSGWFCYTQCGIALTYACRPEEAIPMFQNAIRLNPNISGSAFVNFGEALRMTGRFDEAVSAYKKALQRAPDFIRAHIGLVTIYSLMGREEEARAEAAEIRRINPNYSVDHYVKTVNYKDQSENDKIVNAMRKAGMK
jgi:adenylate cyclase